MNDYGITSIGLFGSYAKDNYDENSDIDIAIEIKKEKKNIHTFFFLQRKLEHDLGKKVDLGINSSFKKIAKEQIENEIIYV